MRRALTCLFIFTILIYGCKEEENGGSTNGPNNEAPSGANPQLSGTLITTSFVGKVTDLETNEPVEGALVRIGNQTTTSNESGYYLLENAQVDADFALLEITGNGYFTQFRNLKPKSGEMNSVDVLLLERTFSGAIESSTGGEVMISGGQGKVILPPDGFVTTDGTAYNGQVIVATTYLNPTDPNINSIVPGSMLAVNSEDELAFMTTFGMINVELYGSGGQQLQLADGESASMEFPVQSEQSGYAPTEIPLWFFDEATGIWREEGLATISGNKYIASVKHFTYWNCDIAAQTANLSGYFTYQGEPFTSNEIKLKMVRPEFNNSWAYAVHSGDGNFYSVIPANEPLELSVVGEVCNEEDFYMSLPPQSPNTEVDLGEVALDSYLIESNYIEITATILDCNGEPASEAVFEYNVESTPYGGYVYSNSEGDISFELSNCQAQIINYTALALDQAGSVIGQEGSFSIDQSSTDTDLGNLLLCEDFTLDGSYITYNDGEGISSFNPSSSSYPWPFGADCTVVQYWGGQNETVSWFMFETPISTGPVQGCLDTQEIKFGGVLDGGNTIEALFDETAILINITELEIVSDSISLIMGTYEGEALVTIKDDSQIIIEEYTTNAQGVFRFDP